MQYTVHTCLTVQISIPLHYTCKHHEVLSAGNGGKNAFQKQEVTEQKHLKVAFVYVLCKMTSPLLHAFCGQFMKIDPLESICQKAKKFCNFFLCNSVRKMPLKSQNNVQHIIQNRHPFLRQLAIEPRCCCS